MELNDRHLLEQLRQIRDVDGRLARHERMTLIILIMVTALAALALAMMVYGIGFSS